METNEILKKQAGDLLQNYETLNVIASVTGSCALDLMVCPDLDLHVPADQVKNLFGLAEILYQNRLTDELYIQKGATVGIPEGQHIQVRTNLLSEHAKWKIDVWILPAGSISQKSAQIDSLNKRLTDADRDQILELKKHLLQPNGFTPKYSGIHIYRAYLDEGIRELASLKDYLRSKGISLV